VKTENQERGDETMKKAKKLEQISDAIETTHDAERKPRLVKRATPPATCDDPREELRKLVRQHRALVRSAVAVENMSSDRTNHTTGETMPCLMPLIVQTGYHEIVKSTKAAASALKKDMLHFLKQIPIYQTFLRHVYGVGPVVAAYLVSEINIRHRPEKNGVVGDLKPSAVRRFCGVSVMDDGRLEHPVAGQKNHYCSEMRVRLYQMMDSMWKNAAKKPDRAHKYLEIWKNKKAQKLLLAVDGKIGDHSAAGYAHSCGRWTAVGVFLNDLYVVWRALEGLDIWPGWYAAKLGYGHGGVKIDNQRPTQLTADQALELVGDVS
jgi:hypothetical protein